MMLQDNVTLKFEYDDPIEDWPIHEVDREISAIEWEIADLEKRAKLKKLIKKRNQLASQGRWFWWRRAGGKWD